MTKCIIIVNVNVVKKYGLNSSFFISVHSIKIIQPIKILLPRIAVILYDKRRIQVCLSIYSVRGKR